MVDLMPESFIPIVCYSDALFESNVTEKSERSIY